MTYFNKNKELKRGYNAYIDESTNYMGTLMNVGLLVMEDGDAYYLRKRRPTRLPVTLSFRGQGHL